MLAGQLDPSRYLCPNCGGAVSRVVDRKLAITQLRRCHGCRILFRTPTDGADFGARFYQNEYAQGFTTDIPSNEELEILLTSRFSNSEKNYTYYIDILNKLGLGGGSKIFDFGCSWGYGSYQMKAAGFDVLSYEIAVARREFGRARLGLCLVEDMEEACRKHYSEVDCFFSAHVLEHVSSPATVFLHAARLLKTGGIFVSFTPNGSECHRTVSASWSKLWGQVHPNFIDEIFLDRSFYRSPRSFGTSPVKEVNLPMEARARTLNSLDGDELFFAARKIGNSWC
jgi:SAM-dependent methyltransferase